MGAKRRVARMKPEDAQAWVKRWQLVNDAEREELRATSIDLKLRQWAAMMILAKQLGWSEALSAEEEVVRYRWNLLRQPGNV